MRKECYVITLLLLMLSHVGVHGQIVRQTELFCGAELFYRDVNFLRIYDVRLNATPGVKINMKQDWQIAGQVQIPLVNLGYDKRYGMVRLSMANVSKELHFSKAKQHLKITAGLYGQDRFGGDVRWMYPVSKWLMFNARLGLTSKWGLGFDFKRNTEVQFENNWDAFCVVGANIWLDKWDTELRASGGRYMSGSSTSDDFDNYGVEGEVARHFKHCTATAFMQYHRPMKTTGGTHKLAGGFRVVMMIPPYKKSTRKVVFRPASNFRLTYNAQSDGYSMKKYRTDPEENERTNPVNIPWGTDKFNE